MNVLTLDGLSKTQGTGWDSNPRRRITGAVSSPLDDQCSALLRRETDSQGGRVRTGDLKLPELADFHLSHALIGDESSGP
jgi:hypothetical protein